MVDSRYAFGLQDCGQLENNMAWKGSQAMARLRKEVVQNDLNNTNGDQDPQKDLIRKGEIQSLDWILTILSGLKKDLEEEHEREQPV